MTHSLAPASVLDGVPLLNGNKPDQRQGQQPVAASGNSSAGLSVEPKATTGTGVGTNKPGTSVGGNTEDFSDDEFDWGAEVETSDGKDAPAKAPQNDSAPESKTESDPAKAATPVAQNYSSPASKAESRPVERTGVSPEFAQEDDTLNPIRSPQHTDDSQSAAHDGPNADASNGLHSVSHDDEGTQPSSTSQESAGADTQPAVQGDLIPAASNGLHSVSHDDEGTQPSSTSQESAGADTQPAVQGDLIPVASNGLHSVSHDDEGTQPSSTSQESAGADTQPAVQGDLIPVASNGLHPVSHDDEGTQPSSTSQESAGADTHPAAQGLIPVASNEPQPVSHDDEGSTLQESAGADAQSASKDASQPLPQEVGQVGDSDVESTAKPLGGLGTEGDMASHAYQHEGDKIENVDVDSSAPSGQQSMVVLQDGPARPADVQNPADVDEIETHTEDTNSNTGISEVNAASSLGVSSADTADSISTPQESSETSVADHDAEVAGDRERIEAVDTMPSATEDEPHARPHMHSHRRPHAHPHAHAHAGMDESGQPSRHAHKKTQDADTQQTTSADSADSAAASASSSDLHNDVSVPDTRDASNSKDGEPAAAAAYHHNTDASETNDGDAKEDADTEATAPENDDTEATAPERPYSAGTEDTAEETTKEDVGAQNVEGGLNEAAKDDDDQTVAEKAATQTHAQESSASNAFGEDSENTEPLAALDIHGQQRQRGGCVTVQGHTSRAPFYVCRCWPKHAQCYTQKTCNRGTVVSLKMP